MSNCIKALKRAFHIAVFRNSVLTSQKTASTKAKYSGKIIAAHSKNYTNTYVIMGRMQISRILKQLAQTHGTAVLQDQYFKQVQPRLSVLIGL
jgi:hypothetical protein